MGLPCPDMARTVDISPPEAVIRAADDTAPVVLRRDPRIPGRLSGPCPDAQALDA